MHNVKHNDSYVLQLKKKKMLSALQKALVHSLITADLL